MNLYSGNIFLFDENGLSIFKENVLQVPRFQHVIMPIAKDDFTCAAPMAAKSLDINIMVATGVNGMNSLADTEVIDAETITSCANLPAKYPNEVKFAVAMQHNSNMVICGGFPRTGDCYSYSNDAWNMEDFRLEPARYAAMSAKIRPGEWLVMGGFDGANYLNDSKLLKNGQFQQGPDLPEPVVKGSSVMLNETHLFMAGGRYQQAEPFYSPRNYLLDINSGQWTQIADREMQPMRDHASGTFLNSTAGEIQIANVGRLGIEVYSPRDNSWHQVPFPSPITELWLSTAIQQGYESFLLIGGTTNLGLDNGDVYLFDENGLSILKKNVLQVPRRHHVAMAISKDYFTCE